MARVHGKDADFSFDSTAMEGYSSSVRLNFTVPEAEITAFGDAYQNFLAGKPGATIDVDGFWDTTPDAVIFGELGLDAEEWDFEPSGGTGYNGFGFLTSYTITAPVGGAVTTSMSIRHNGGAAEADGAAPTRA